MSFYSIYRFIRFVLCPVYAQDEPIAAEAKRIINEIALTGWTSGGHSAGYVPVFAIGAGAEKFQNRIDNTEIPVKIAEAAGYTRK